MFFATILLCAIGQVCTPETATDRIVMPDQFVSSGDCFLRAQAFVAATALPQGMTVRVLCGQKAPPKEQ